MKLLDNPSKYLDVLRLNLLENTAFRGSMLLSFIHVPLLFLIYSSIWAQGFSSQGLIHGYTFPILITGLMVSVILRNLISNTTQGEIIENHIQEGTILVYLVRPISFFWQQCMEDFGRVFVKAIFGIPAMILLFAFVAQRFPGIGDVLLATILVMLGAFMFFELTFISSLASFWIGESWGLRNLIVNSGWLLGGAIVPITFFPHLLQNISAWLPFQYAIFVPSELLMGRGTAEMFIHALLVLSAWIIALYLIKFPIWHAGLKHHDGKG